MSKPASNGRRAAPTPTRRTPPPPPPRRTAPPPPRPAVATTTPPVEKPAEKPNAKPARKRSTPMERAVKFARLLDKNLHRLLRLTSNWTGEATADQRDTNTEIVKNLRAVQPTVARVLLDVGALQASGFAPSEPSGNLATPLAAGDQVAFREKHYVPALHGEVNEFEVIVVAQNQARIRPLGDIRAPQVLTPTSHLKLLLEGADLEVEEPIDEAADEGEDALEGDAELEPEDAVE